MTDVQKRSIAQAHSAYTDTGPPGLCNPPLVYFATFGARPWASNTTNPGGRDPVPGLYRRCAYLYPIKGTADQIPQRRRQGLMPDASRRAAGKGHTQEIERTDAVDAA